MIKFLMGLITAFASFMGFLGTTNPVLANSLVNEKLTPVMPDSVEHPVSLNISNSLWQLTDGNAKTIFDHLGCSCAACSQTVETNL